MTLDDRRRWNAKHEDAPPPGEAHAFVLDQTAELLERLPPGARALDVACGRGRNALHLSRLGLRVTAVDVSDVALERLEASAREEGLTLTTVRSDVLADGLPQGPFDLIVVTSFLERSLFGPLAAHLAPGGLLLYSTFTTARSIHTQGRFRLEYCLQPGELEESFPTLTRLTVKEHEDEHEEEASALFLRES